LKQLGFLLQITSYNKMLKRSKIKGLMNYLDIRFKTFRPLAQSKNMPTSSLKSKINKSQPDKNIIFIENWLKISIKNCLF
jgi:hypothetical protein